MLLTFALVLSPFALLALGDEAVHLQPACKSIAYRELGIPNLKYVLDNRDQSFDELCWSNPGKQLHNGRQSLFCWCATKNSLDHPDLQYSRFQCSPWPKNVAESIFINKTRFPYEDPPFMDTAMAEMQLDYSILKSCYLSCTCPNAPAPRPQGMLYYNYLSRPKQVVRTSFTLSSQGTANTIDQVRTKDLTLKAIELTELADERLKPNCAASCSGFQGPSACDFKRRFPGCETVFCRVAKRSNGMFFGIGICQLAKVKAQLTTENMQIDVYLDRKHNKRVADEEITGCPCNATYVSEGCCGSRTGIIWEAPELKLGQLELE